MLIELGDILLNKIEGPGTFYILEGLPTDGFFTFRRGDYDDAPSFVTDENYVLSCIAHGEMKWVKKDDELFKILYA